MATSIIEAATDAPSARYINPIVSVLNGTDGHTGYINVVKWGDATTPTARFCNTNTGGESLVAYAANGSTKILAANNTGVTLAAGLTVNGNVSIGTTSANTVSIVSAVNLFSTLSVRNNDGSLFPLFADVANNKVVIGNPTGAALSGTVGSVLDVVGQAYFAPVSPGSESAVHIWRSTSSGAGWVIGVTATDQLKFVDNGGQGIVTFGDTSSTYQLEVTGNGNILGVLSVEDDAAPQIELRGTGGFNGILYYDEGGSLGAFAGLDNANNSFRINASTAGYDIRLMTQSVQGLRVEPNGISIGSGAGSFGSGVRVIFIENRGTAPTSNPSGGGILYAESGAGKWRGSGGTTTTFGPAEPHCPVCDRDFAWEWESPRYGALTICAWCFTEGAIKGIMRRQSPEIQEH